MLVLVGGRLVVGAGHRGLPFTEAPYGIGLPKGDTYVREAFNEALRQMWNDGTMEQLVEANLGASGYAPRPDLNPPTVGGHCG